jgi:hypothetical protein
MTTWRRDPDKYTDNEPIDIYARLTGALEYLCPACGKMQVVGHFNYRSARVQCKKDRDLSGGKCRRIFRVGLLFSSKPSGKPPTNGLMSEMLCERRVAFNRLEGMDEPQRLAIARITGTVEWWCPICACWKKEMPEWQTGRVCCLNGHEFYVRPILWVPPKGMSLRTPIDWVPPLSGRGWNDDQRVDAGETHVEGDGAHSDSAGALSRIDYGAGDQGAGDGGME